MGNELDNVTHISGTEQHETKPKPTSSATAKKKKKKKNGTTSNVLNGKTNGEVSDESRPLANEESIRGDGVEEWRARAMNRRVLLADSKAENAVLSADLAAALARVNDAELAEEAVNKGLVKARSVISQRDIALSDLNASTNNLKAENAKLTEEKKRLEKRLLILKTVSVNLQEAREARDNMERKADELNKMNVKLREEIVGLKKDIEALNMVKQQLARAELDLDELQQANDELQVKARNDCRRVAGIGAAGAVALSVTVRLLASRKRRE